MRRPNSERENGNTRSGYMAQWRQKHLDEKREADRVYASTHKESARERGRAYRAGLREDAINAYGGKCSCCGETLAEGLCIDHIHNGGGKQRRELGLVTSSQFYEWLKTNGYPPGYQVLCATCNMAKGTGDHCTHRDLQAGLEYAAY